MVSNARLQNCVAKSSKSRRSDQLRNANDISTDLVEHYNGVRKHSFGRAEESNQIGIVTGLAWTQVGGELLNIEAVAVPGKGKQTKTGSLGDVMQESIQAALTFVQESRASAWHSTQFPRNERYPCACAGRRHAEGWPQRRYWHVYRDHLGAHRNSGAC